MYYIDTMLQQEWNIGLLKSNLTPSGRCIPQLLNESGKLTSIHTPPPPTHPHLITQHTPPFISQQVSDVITTHQGLPLARALDFPCSYISTMHWLAHCLPYNPITRLLLIFYRAAAPDNKHSATLRVNRHRGRGVSSQLIGLWNKPNI